MEILDAFLAGFINVFTWPTLPFMVLGIVIGFVIGILPGIGGIVALALMLPFTLAMEPAAALALLLATTTVSSNASDLTSILFGVPGDGASSALIVDGYPMAKKGEAGRALSGNLVASLVGATIGVFAIVAAIPIVRPLVLSFGSPEFFMLTVLGITFVSSLTSSAPVKGISAGLLGVLLSLVGRDSQVGIQRYTFEILHLWEGIGLVPLALGIFAVPEIYELAVRGTSISDRPYSKLTGVWQGIKDVWIHRWLVVRCSLIGTFVGIIPGLGAAVGQWTAYTHAVQSSPNKERFGKGAVEGALGPGAANNSTLGGTLIPVIAFGIPGGLATALLLGALLIHGVVPGPRMITDLIDVTMSFVWIIVIANVITVLISLPLLKYLARITYVRGAFVVPIVMVLLYIGAFGNRDTLLDIAIVLMFGCVGIVMARLGWPRPPLILAFVLAELTETYFFRSYVRYEFAFLARPIVVVLLAVTVLALVWPLLSRQNLRARIGGRKSVEAVVGDDAEGDAVSVASQRTLKDMRADAIFAGVLLLVSAYALWPALDWPFAAAMMPVGASISLGAVTIGFLVTLFLRARGMGEAERSAPADEVESARNMGVQAFVAVWVVGGALSLWLVGFVLTSAMMTVTYMRFRGKEAWWLALAVSGVLALLVWVLGASLSIPFPAGVVVELLRP